MRAELVCLRLVKDMRNIAAYLLAVMGGNEAPDAAAIKAILSSVGVEGDDERIAAFLKEAEGKTVEELIAAGQSKLAAVPSGGVAAGGASTGGAAAAAEETKEEEEEEEADFGGGGLFGDDEEDDW